MDSSEQRIRLRWSWFTTTSMSKWFYDQLQNDMFINMSICCEEQMMGVHQCVMSNASPYLHNIIMTVRARSMYCHPVVVLPANVRIFHLRLLIKLLYTGECELPQSEIEDVCHAAAILQVHGIRDYSEHVNAKQQGLLTFEKTSAPKESHSKSAEIINEMRDADRLETSFALNSTQLTSSAEETIISAAVKPSTAVSSELESVFSDAGKTLSLMSTSSADLHLQSDVHTAKDTSSSALTSTETTSLVLTSIAEVNMEAAIKITNDLQSDSTDASSLVVTFAKEENMEAATTTTNDLQPNISSLILSTATEVTIEDALAVDIGFQSNVSVTEAEKVLSSSPKLLPAEKDYHDCEKITSFSPAIQSTEEVDMEGVNLVSNFLKSNISGTDYVSQPHIFTPEAEETSSFSTLLPSTEEMVDSCSINPEISSPFNIILSEEKTNVKTPFTVSIGLQTDLFITSPELFAKNLNKFIVTAREKIAASSQTPLNMSMENDTKKSKLDIFKTQDEIFVVQTRESINNVNIKHNTPAIMEQEASPSTDAIIKSSTLRSILSAQINLEAKLTTANTDAVAGGSTDEPKLLASEHIGKDVTNEIEDVADEHKTAAFVCCEIDVLRNTLSQEDSNHDMRSLVSSLEIKSNQHFSTALKNNQSSDFLATSPKLLSQRAEINSCRSPSSGAEITLCQSPNSSQENTQTDDLMSTVTPIDQEQPVATMDVRRSTRKRRATFRFFSPEVKRTKYTTKKSKKFGNTYFLSRITNTPKTRPQKHIFDVTGLANDPNETQLEKHVFNTDVRKEKQPEKDVSHLTTGQFYYKSVDPPDTKITRVKGVDKNLPKLFSVATANLVPEVQQGSNPGPSFQNPHTLMNSISNVPYLGNGAILDQSSEAEQNFDVSVDVLSENMNVSEYPSFNDMDQALADMTKDLTTYDATKNKNSSNIRAMRFLGSKNCKKQASTQYIHPCSICGFHFRSESGVKLHKSISHGIGGLMRRARRARDAEYKRIASLRKEAKEAIKYNEKNIFVES